MAGFSSGVYTRVHRWVDDRLADIDITDSRMDEEDDSIAAALSMCILKDGTQTVTADLSMNSHLVTNLANATLGHHALNMQTGDATYVKITTLTVATGPLTLTTSGPTNVTLPTSGTLATLAGVEQLSNKTIDTNLNILGSTPRITFHELGVVMRGFDCEAGVFRLLNYPETTTTFTNDNAGNTGVSGTFTAGAGLTATTGTFSGGISAVSAILTGGGGPALSCTSTVIPAYFTTTGGLACISTDRISGPDGNIILFHRNSGLVGSIGVTSTTTSYNTSSDARLKTNVQDFDAGVLIDQIEPKRFEFTNQPGVTHYGFLAQDLEPVYPNAVSAGSGEPGDGAFQPWSVDLSKLVPLLVAEIQSLRARVAVLEA